VADMNIIERQLPDGPRFKSGPNKGDQIPNNPHEIIIHAMGEYINDKAAKFAPNFLEEYGLSAHALIVPNGDVMICRQTDECAHHALGHNIDSLGVEFLVHGLHDYGSFLEAIKTDWVTPEQYAAGIELVSTWRKGFNIKGRKVDPGAGFKWEYFINQLQSA